MWRLVLLSVLTAAVACGLLVVMTTGWQSDPAPPTSFSGTHRVTVTIDGMNDPTDAAKVYNLLTSVPWVKQVHMGADHRAAEVGVVVVTRDYDPQSLVDLLAQEGYPSRVQNR